MLALVTALDISKMKAPFRLTQTYTLQSNPICKGYSHLKTGCTGFEQMYVVIASRDGTCIHVVAIFMNIVIS